MTSNQGFSFNFPLPQSEKPTASQDDSDNLISAEVSRIPRDLVESKKSNFFFLSDVEKMLRTIPMDEIDSAIVLKTYSKDSNDSNGDLRRVCIPKESNHVKNQQSDIIPGEYEGGLKIWECSLDLCRYLLKHLDKMRPSFVAELGCGHGLPGCLTLQNSLKNKTNTKVLFADFNDFVIKDVTIANILLNTIDFKVEEVAKSVVLGAGDWNQMSTVINDNCTTRGIEGIPSTGRFDLLLAAETTYTFETAKATAKLFASHLDPTKGVGLVATKRYYFGCGGGTDAFHYAASKETVTINKILYKLDITIEEIFDNGAGNIRELLKVVLEAME